jgi:hypothetical protein
MFTFRSPVELRIWPKKALGITIDDGDEKIGVFVTLNSLLSDPSTRAIPGPRTIPTPALPKV